MIYTANKPLEIYDIAPEGGKSNSIGQSPMYMTNNTNQP